MARPRLARHMLDHHREQALTEHLGREWQGYETGNGVSRARGVGRPLYSPGAGKRD